MARAGGGQGRLEMINPGRLPCQAYTSPMSAAQLTLPEPAGPSGLRTMLVLDLTMSSSLSYDASSRKSSRMTWQEGAWTPTAPASGPYLATGLATVICELY